MSNSKTKNYFESVETTIDEEGNVKELKKTVRRKVERDKFAMMYLKDISKLFEISTKGEYRVLIALVKRSSYNTNEVRVAKDVKEEIAEETGLAYSTVHQSVAKLSKSEIIIRKKKDGKEVRGVYILSPKYFFKGEEMERARVVKLVMEYSIED